MSDNLTTPDDEIDLFELIETLWSEKILIAGITFVAGILGAIYAFIATPTFEAEIRLLPAEKTQLAQYNPVDFYSLSDLEISPLTPESALNQTLDVMRSAAKINEFIQQRQLETFSNQAELSSDELFEAAAGLVSYSVKIEKKKDSPQTAVTYSASNAVESYAFLSELTDWAQLQVLIQRSSEIQNIINRRLDANSLKVQRLTQTYERRLAEQVAVLAEALSIAKSLNIIENQAGVFVAEGEGRLRESSTLYLKGSRLLQAEIDAYQNRLTDARFLRQVRLFEEENQTLMDLKTIELPQGSIIAIDKPVVLPKFPIKPNKKLIVALAVVLGGMIGILFVLIRQAIRNRSISAAT